MIKKITLLCFIIGLVSGCGFTLRGKAAIPAWLNRVAIVVVNANPSLATVAQDLLQSYSVTIIADPKKADFVLTLEQDSLNQQITSVSSSTTPRQYQLVYSLHYLLTNVKNKTVLLSQTMVVNRQFTVNNDRILGSDFEGLTIAKEMRRDAVHQIITRISRQQ